MQYKGIWTNSQIHLPAIVQYPPVRELFRTTLNLDCQLFFRNSYISELLQPHQLFIIRLGYAVFVVIAEFAIKLNSSN